MKYLMNNDVLIYETHEMDVLKRAPVKQCFLSTAFTQHIGIAILDFG